jgi:acyl CoA:acetate/3-ketoacid CoA transferase alpha subunit
MDACRWGAVPVQRVADMQTVSLEQAVAMIPDGASLMIGGFMAVGTPERVVDGIVRQNKRHLTIHRRVAESER